MRVPRRLVAIAASAAVATGAVTAAHATYEGANGLLVYQGRVTAHTQLFTIRPDGGAARQLTSWEDSDAINAEWSPDGKRIAFVRYWQHPKERWAIYVMNADGSGLHALDRTLRGDLVLNWLPDSKHVLTVRALKLVIADAFGASVRKADIPGLASSACVLADGKRVALLAGRSLGSAESAIFIGRIGGGRGSSERITPWQAMADKIDCSPDGTKVAFSAPHFGPPRSSNVFTIGVDGTGLRQLTHTKGGRINNGVNSWSPDGKKIAFVSNRSGPFEIHTMNVDGSAVTQVTHDPDAHRASWGSHP